MMNYRELFKRVSRSLRSNARAFNRQFWSVAPGNGFCSRQGTAHGDLLPFEVEIVRKACTRASAPQEAQARILFLLQANSSNVAREQIIHMAHMWN